MAARDPKVKIDRKIEALKKALDEYVKTAVPDQNLIKANTEILKEKEDLADRNEILYQELLSNRRELEIAGKTNERLNLKVEELESELSTYRESIGMLQSLSSTKRKG